jgi:hypothetical protein
MAESVSKTNRYDILIERVFFKHWTKGKIGFSFERREIETHASELGILLPKNLGDLIYSFRYRASLPQSIRKTQPQGKEWLIVGAGRAKYEFRLASAVSIVPRKDLKTIEIFDATPEIIKSYALTDEQALLAIVRYNRLIDVFLGIVTYSLQGHLRTTVKKIGQMEIDEVYVGIDKLGNKYVVPVQAKGGRDKLGVVQIEQDFAFSTEKFPDLICRPVAAQFMKDGVVALLELGIDRGTVKIVEEKHYRLVPSDRKNP